MKENTGLQTSQPPQTLSLRGYGELDNKSFAAAVYDSKDARLNSQCARFVVA